MSLAGYSHKNLRLILVILGFLTAVLILIIGYQGMAARLFLIFIFAYILFELRAALKRESELIRLDSLTKVINRKYFYDLAATEMYRLRRYKRSFTAAYIDIDNLKIINYRFGHNAGDNLLQIVASTIRRNIREVDVISRFGGDEFVILLPETGAEGAQIVLSRLRNKLLDEMKKNNWSITFSFGVGTFTCAPDSVEDMIKKTEVLMYSAKNSGANMIDQEIFDASTKAQHQP